MSDSLTLPINMLVNVDIEYQAKLLSRDSFNRLCIVGSSPNSRNTPSGIYTSTEGVKKDYGVEANEYKIAKAYFSQNPKPRDLMITSSSGSARKGSYFNIVATDYPELAYDSVYGASVALKVSAPSKFEGLRKYTVLSSLISASQFMGFLDVTPNQIAASEVIAEVCYEGSKWAVNNHRTVVREVFFNQLSQEPIADPLPLIPNESLSIDENTDVIVGLSELEFRKQAYQIIGSEGSFENSSLAIMPIDLLPDYIVNNLGPDIQSFTMLSKNDVIEIMRCTQEDLQLVTEENLISHTTDMFDYLKSTLPIKNTGAEALGYAQAIYNEGRDVIIFNTGFSYSIEYTPA